MCSPNSAATRCTHRNRQRCTARAAGIAHKIPSGGEFVHLSVEVSDSQIVHQFNAGSGWQVLDTWSRTTPAEGRFGFYLPGSETLEVSNFR